MKRIEKLIESKAKKFLEIFRQKYPNIKKGYLAGGSVSAYVAFDETDVKDYDVFIPIDRLPKKVDWKRTSPIISNNVIVQLDNYGGVIVRNSIYRVIHSLRVGKLNIVHVTPEDRYIKLGLDDLISSFDINAVQCGIDIATGEVKYTDNFIRFMATKELSIEVFTSWSWIYSLIRLYDKYTRFPQSKLNMELFKRWLALEFVKSGVCEPDDYLEDLRRGIGRGVDITRQYYDTHKDRISKLEKAGLIKVEKEEYFISIVPTEELIIENKDLLEAYYNLEYIQRLLVRMRKDILHSFLATGKVRRRTGNTVEIITDVLGFGRLDKNQYNYILKAMSKHQEISEMFSIIASHSSKESYPEVVEALNEFIRDNKISDITRAWFEILSSEIIDFKHYDKESMMKLLVKSRDVRVKELSKKLQNRLVFKYKDFEITSLVTGLEIEDNAEYMHNCTAGYTGRVANLKYIILKAKKGNRVANIGIGIDDSRTMYLDQMFLRFNESINTDDNFVELKKVILKWITQHKREAYNLIDPEIKQDIIIDLEDNRHRLMLTT